jgi:hypothetical protein
MARGANLRNAPVGDIVVLKNGKLTPVTRPPLAWYGGKGIDDVRTISSHFLLSLQRLWEEEGDSILKRVAAQQPELIFSAMVKLVNVMRVEVDSPGDSFSNIVEKLEEMAGPRHGRCLRSSWAISRGCAMATIQKALERATLK